MLVDKDLNITRTLRELAMYDAQLYVPDNDDDVLKFKVKWLGFPENESAWKPSEQLLADAQVLVWTFLSELRKNKKHAFTSGLLKRIVAEDNVSRSRRNNAAD